MSTFIEAQNKVKCPLCGAQPGWPCRSPVGRKSKRPHVERLMALGTTKCAEQEAALHKDNVVVPYSKFLHYKLEKQRLS